LKEADLRSKDDIKSHVRNLMKSKNAYQSELKKLHKVVADRWAEVETTFLPKWSKYGD
jgi:hypothetical protein